MKTELIIALLGMACIGSLAAFFVAWAKYDEQKKLTKEEYEKRWDEISRALSIEKELEQEKQYFRHADAESFEHYQNAKEARMKCGELQDRLSALQTELEQEKAYFDACRAGNHALQDRLSAILCPMNDHVWKDGVCVKCGRVQDA